MSTARSLRGFLGFLSLLALSSLPATAQAEPVAATSFEPPGEDEAAVPAERGAVYARLTHFEGGISFRRDDDDLASGFQLTVNTALVPGDQIWTGQDGRAEIQLADGSILRLDRGSRLSLLNLADREGSFDDTTLLRLLNGSLHVRADGFDPRARRFQIDTPAGSIFLLSEGLFRVDVAPNGVSTLASYRGVAEFLAEDVSIMAHSGERVSTEPGYRPGDPRAFNTLRRDDFDLWAENRDDAIAGTDSARGPRPEVPEPVRPYVSELDRYGVWRNDPEYGWIWIPEDVEPDWRPYYYGHWSWAPIGPVWVGYEPWGWAPYHYGRWQWATGFGWFWAPGWVYSGAYVSWSMFPGYYGWCPMGYWNYPVYYGGYYPWVYVPYNYIYDPHVYHHSIGWADAAKRHLGGDGVLLRDHPLVKPGYGIEKAAGRTYRRALANPTYVKNLPPPSNGAGKASFRGADQTTYRKFLARKATPEPAGKIGKPAATPSRGGPAVRPGGTIPRSFSSGAAVKPVGAGGARTHPISTARPSVPGKISPVTGKPIQRPVRMTTAPRSTGRSSTGSPAVGPKMHDPAPPPFDSKPPIQRPRVSKPRDGSGSVPGRAAPSPGQVKPHPRYEPGRGGNGKVPFVTPKSPAGASRPSGIGSRGPRPSAPRPAPTPSKAPAKQGGGHGKGGKG